MHFAAASHGPAASNSSATLMILAGAGYRSQMYNNVVMPCQLHACLQVKEVCKWEVQAPQLLYNEPSSPDSKALPDGYWQVVKLHRKIDGSNWLSPSLKTRWADGIRRNLTLEHAQNFEVS
jgi:hypothetical protein